MFVPKTKILPQNAVEENLSGMARLFRTLVKICFFPIQLYKEQKKIKFSLLSLNFALYNVVYQSFPSFVIWIFPQFYYGMDEYYSFLMDIFEKTAVTDVVAMLGYTFMLAFFLLAFYILLFKAQGNANNQILTFL